MKSRRRLGSDSSWGSGRCKDLTFQSLFRADFIVESTARDGDGFLIAIRGAADVGCCPARGRTCSRVHSRYRRRLSDLPAAGVRMALVLQTRRFFCDVEGCAQRIFAERFEAVEPRARRTTRLDDVVHCLAIALGGRPAASLSRRLNVLVSNDTLLRMVRRRGPRSFPPPSIVGIDDWAWRRNFRYGTLICDLERRKTIALLPDREPTTAEAWLKQWPDITVVARDRGGSYALAAQRALPNASRSPIAGISWRTPARPSSTPSANRCA